MGNEVGDITLQLGNSIIKKDNLKEYIQKDEIQYSSYLFNSVCFDYSKMIKLSYSYNNIINVLYIDKNNTFIRDINNIRTTGPLYLTLDLSQTYSYQVIMSSLIDVTSLFSLFE